MIKTIIFDYAGVLTATKNKYNFALQNHKRFNVELTELLDIFYKEWDLAATGQISEKEYWKEIGSKLNINPNEIRDLIYAAFPIEERVVRIIDQIKGRYTLVMVSNQLEDWLEKVIDDNDFRSKFNYFANSYQIGISKPDKRIFEAALSKSASKPDESLFIDDSKENIESAKKMGMQVIQFVNFDQFLREFKKYVNLEVISSESS